MFVIMKTNPIGLFDSGIGGTSIWKETISVLPNENTIFLADSKNAPYGAKSKQEIINLSIKNTETLLEQGCKLIIVACNTATTNAIDYLRANYNIPFIGIEPAIKPAALQTKTQSVGILATKGTLSSALFNKTSSLYANNINVTEQVGEGLVDLIENGKLYSNEMTSLLTKYTKTMIAAHIDYLVLGCTHYPYLIPQLRELLGPEVTIIDSGQAVAKQTKNILTQYNLAHPLQTEPSTHHIFTNRNETVTILEEFISTNKHTSLQFLQF